MKKDIEINQLSSTQRLLFQAFVIVGLLLFLLIFFLTSKRVHEDDSRVYLKDSKLHVFGQEIKLEEFPDRLAVHYPYLLVIQPEKSKTQIFNLESKKRVKDSDKIILDYDGQNEVYNQNGIRTYFNNINLNASCSRAFIKTNKEIICLTQDAIGESKLMYIDPRDRHKTIFYTPRNILTEVSWINDKLYVAEIDSKGKSYLKTHGKLIPVESPINLIYPLNGIPHIATFKNTKRKLKESYSKVDFNRNIPKVINIKDVNANFLLIY